MKRLNTAEAGALIGRDPSWIRLLAGEGKLKGWEKIGRDWVGPESSVLAYAAKGLKPGRPPAKRRPVSRSA